MFVVFLFRVCVLSLLLEVMFLSSCDWVYLVLDLLKTSLLIFLVICKDSIDSETVVIIAIAHLSQLRIVHPSRIYTFGMCIRHVDSWVPSACL